MTLDYPSKSGAPVPRSPLESFQPDETTRVQALFTRGETPRSSRGATKLDFFGLSERRNSPSGDSCERSELGYMSSARRKVYNIGINAGPAAGQTVEHTHVHLVPRYVGDVLWIPGAGCGG